MNERHEGKHLRRQEAKKRWKTILAVFLSVVLVMQSSNIQAFADVLSSGGPEGRDEVVMDPAAEDTGTQGEVTTPEETDTADEQASPQDDAEQTVAETEESPVETTAQDTEATTPDGQSDQAQSEQAPAEETDTTVTLNVEVSAATLKYSAQDGTEKSVTSETDPKSVDVSNTLDFTFTVAPDDGQLVSSVAYAGTELVANESGEYTIAAADLTDGEKIVVTTEAVPMEEPAEDATPVEPEETAEPEFDAEKSVAPEDEAKVEETVDGATNAIESFATGVALLAAGNESGTVTVTVKKTDMPDYSAQVELPLGQISAESAESAVVSLDELEGYEYRDARVDNVEVISINQHGDTYYVTTGENQIAGIALDSTTDVVLYFQPEGSTYQVNYKVMLGNEEVVGDNIPGDLIGPETVNKGEDLSMSFVPDYGFEIEGVTVSDGLQADSSSGVYLIGSVNDTDGDRTITVTVSVKEIDRYNIVFENLTV